MNFDRALNILGITIDTSEQDVKKTYRRLVKKYHPDVSETGDSTKYKLVIEAYEKYTSTDKVKYKQQTQQNKQSVVYSHEGTFPGVKQKVAKY